MNTLGVLLVAGAMIVSMVRVLSIREQLFDPDKTIIRICHWQLELGYRQALQNVIEEYEKLHPGVVIKQMPVTEKIYGQWLNTHLISGTAPDIAEMGMAKLASDTQYLARFFLPLTELIDQPNPYNAETEMADWPWRETFIDGMRGGYRVELQDTFSAPTNVHTSRIYYNRDLLRQITGSDAAPQTMGKLLAMCDRIREYARETGLGDRMIPIASSRYNTPQLLNRYRVPFTAALEAELDLDLDGVITDWEGYTAFVEGKVSYAHPNIRAFYECTRVLSDQFNPGFMSMGREDSTFMFIQQNAVMVCTGSWDSMSLFAQAEFDVGVFGFPLPAPGERWGELVAGRLNEATTAGSGLYGICKQSRHAEKAIDFLRFLTSRKQNEAFSRGASWLPVTVGARPSEPMVPFMPDPIGFASGCRLSYGSLSGTVLGGQEWKYFSGEIEYDELAQNVEEALRDPRRGGDKAWAEEYDSVKRWCRNQDRVLAVQSIRVFTSPEARDAPIKYRQALLQQVRRHNGGELRHRFENLRKKPIDSLVD